MNEITVIHQRGMRDPEGCGTWLLSNQSGPVGQISRPPGGAEFVVYRWTRAGRQFVGRRATLEQAKSLLCPPTTYILAEFEEMRAWEYDGDIVAFGSLSDVPDPDRRLLLTDTDDVLERLILDPNCVEHEIMNADEVEITGDEHAVFEIVRRP